VTEPTQSGAGAQSGNALNPYHRLETLGIRLPKPTVPVANFVHVVEIGELLFISGQSPREPNGKLHTGKVGGNVSVKDAYQHARIAAINLLAVLEQHLGDLRRVRRIVKLLGMVNAAVEFTDHPEVINGCSDLLVDVFGPDIGRHARSAVGFASLPRQMTVEIEMIAAFTPA
jgi:enamine deaminase RidA (YjgF/YER057c/UK114 family)